MLSWKVVTKPLLTKSQQKDFHKKYVQPFLDDPDQGSDAISGETALSRLSRLYHGPDYTRWSRIA